MSNLLKMALVTQAPEIVLPNTPPLMISSYNLTFPCLLERSLSLRGDRGTQLPFFVTSVGHMIDKGHMNSVLLLCVCVCDVHNPLPQMT